jgi:hypothetical protein
MADCCPCRDLCTQTLSRASECGQSARDGLPSTHACRSYIVILIGMCTREGVNGAADVAARSVLRLGDCCRCGTTASATWSALQPTVQATVHGSRFKARQIDPVPRPETLHVHTRTPGRKPSRLICVGSDASPRPASRDEKGAVQGRYSTVGREKD